VLLHLIIAYSFPDLVKAFLQQHGFKIRRAENLEAALLEVCGCVTEGMARAWFKHAGYMWND
jgi:hypothetical protein